MSFFDELYSKQNNNTAELNKKRNKIQSVLPEDYNWKKYQIIAETDWITALAYSNGASVEPNQYNPLIATYSNFLDIHLDSRFIPFLNVELITKKQEGLELIGLMEHSDDSYEGDYVEIRGSGFQLIYKGSPHYANYIYDQADLDAGAFDIDYAKMAYNAEITYTEDGSEWKMSGKLVYIGMIKNISMTPYGNQNRDIWRCEYDPIYSQGWDKITILSSTGFTAQVQKIEERWTPYDPVPPSPPYEYQNLTPSQVIISKSFGSEDSESFGFGVNTSVYKKISGNWVWQYNLDYPSVDSLTKTILTRDFSFRGYWVFWNPGSNRTIAVTPVDPPVYEEGWTKLELSNLPVDPYRYWSSIKLLRFPLPHPLPNLRTAVSEPSYHQHVLLKGFKSTELNPELFRLMLDGWLVFKGIANTSNVFKYPTYNDTYTKHISDPLVPADTYDVSESHTFQERTIYYTDEVEIQYKIKVSLINPYEFSARNNYDL
jgi:hypothetical protein